MEEAYMTGARMGAASRDAQAPEYTGKWKHKVSLGLKFNTLESLYMDNRFHMETAAGQIRTVGWHWILGLRIHPSIDLFHEHHSRHVLDQESQSAKLYDKQTSRNFPVEDSYGIRLNIYMGKPGRSILP